LLVSWVRSCSVWVGPHSHFELIIPSSAWGWSFRVSVDRRLRVVVAM
jgi:hypothetical protein